MAIHWEIWLGNVVDRLDKFMVNGEQKSDIQVQQAMALRADLLRIYHDADRFEEDEDKINQTVSSMKQLIRVIVPKSKRLSGGKSFFSSPEKLTRKQRLSRASTPVRGSLRRRVSSRKSLATEAEASNPFFDILRALHDIDVSQQKSHDDKLGGDSKILGEDRFEATKTSLEEARKYLQEKAQQLGLSKSTSTSASTKSDDSSDYTLAQQEPTTTEDTTNYVNLSSLGSHTEEESGMGYQPLTAGLRSESRENEQVLYGDLSQLLSPEEYAEQAERGTNIAFYENCLAIILFNLDCYRNQKLPQVKYPTVYKKQQFSPHADLAKEIGQQLIAQYLHPQLDDDGFLDTAVMIEAVRTVLREAMSQCTQDEKTLFQKLNALYKAIDDKSLTNGSSFFAKQVMNPFLSVENPQAAQQYAQLHVINTVRQYYQDYVTEMNNQQSGSPGDQQAKLKAAQKISSKLGSYTRDPQRINQDIDNLQNGHARWHVNSGDIPILKLIESICDKHNHNLEGIGNLKPRFNEGKYGEVMRSVKYYITEISLDPNGQEQYNLDY